MLPRRVRAFHSGTRELARHTPASTGASAAQIRVAIDRRSASQSTADPRRNRLFDNWGFEQRRVYVLGQCGGCSSLRGQLLLVVVGAEQRCCVGG